MLVHALAPPRPGGTPVVLQRLLDGLPGVRVEVVTKGAQRKAVRAGGERVLNARYRFVHKWPGWGGRWRWGRFVVVAIDLVLAAVAGARTARWARRDGARWIVSVADEGFSPVAGAVAARLARLPHVVMVFDLWEENAYNEAQRASARLLEGRILRSAARVVVFCDEMVTHYRRKHGIDAAAIPTPVELVEAPPVATPDDGREVLITGAVYWAQVDAVARLLRLRDRIPRVRMVALGNERMMRTEGLEADVFEPALSGPAFRARLARAGVVFLGLSLQSEHPEIVRTATPARLVELMSCGRPLLIHAPAGSHVAEYARRERFATVVDVVDEDALLTALQALLDDPGASAEAIERGQRIARERHDAAAVRDAFASLLRDTSRPMRERPTP